MQVAQLFLPAGSPFCFVEDGRGASEDVRLPDSHAITDRPLVICQFLSVAHLQQNSACFLIPSED